MSSPESLHEVLESHSTEKYYIEHQEFFSNHVAEAIVAFHRLGAGHDKLQQFIKHYTRRLESPRDYAKENKDVLASFDDLKGKRRSYYVILEQFLEVAQNSKSLEDIVRTEFPKLSLGLVGSAFHGLIHTGYGYAARNQRVVCDGLAYLHHSYLPLVIPDNGVLKNPLGKNGELEVLDALNVFRQDEDLIDLMEQKSTQLKDDILLNLGDGFGPKIGSLFAFRGEQLLKYASKIRLPDFFDPEQSVASQLDGLLKWLVDLAIKIYVMAETRNDFFLLHGVTSSWALRNLLPIIQDDDVINQTLWVFLCGLLATYMCQGCPKLNPKLLPSHPAGMFSWEKIIDETLSRTDRDEHRYKLVQVCHEMSSVNTDPQMAAVYKEATQIALLYPFVF